MAVPTPTASDGGSPAPPSPPSRSRHRGRGRRVVLFVVPAILAIVLILLLQGTLTLLDPQAGVWASARTAEWGNHTFTMQGLQQPVVVDPGWERNDPHLRAGRSGPLLRPRVHPGVRPTLPDGGGESLRAGEPIVVAREQRAGLRRNVPVSRSSPGGGGDVGPSHERQSAGGLGHAGLRGGGQRLHLLGGITQCSPLPVQGPRRLSLSLEPVRVVLFRPARWSSARLQGSPSPCTPPSPPPRRGIPRSARCFRSIDSTGKTIPFFPGTVASGAPRSRLRVSRPITCSRWTGSGRGPPGFRASRTGRLSPSIKGLLPTLATRSFRT